MKHRRDCHWWLLIWLLAVMPQAVADTLKVESAGGDTLVKFKHEGGVVKIKDGGGETLLKGKPRGDGGRKYKWPAGDTFVKVKTSDAGFKLKGERGGLLWKVKYYGDRVKIGQDEELTLPEVLRRSARDQWDLERDGTPYGKVKYYPEKGRTKVKDAANVERWRVDGVRFSPLAGVLLIPGMPREAAYVIMAEIWLRGW